MIISRNIHQDIIQSLELIKNSIRQVLQMGGGVIPDIQNQTYKNRMEELRGMVKVK